MRSINVIILFPCRLQNCYYKRVFEQSSIRIIETSIESSRFRAIEASINRIIEIPNNRVIELSTDRAIESPVHRASAPLRHARPDAAAPAAEVCAASRAPSVRCRRPKCLVRPSARAGVRAQPHGHWRASGGVSGKILGTND